MNKKILSIILGAALAGSFFLDYGGGASGLDIVQVPVSDWHKYLYLVFPVCGLMLLVGALNNDNYFVARILWAVLPLLTVLFILVGIPLMNGVAIGDIFKMLGKGYGIGWWVTIGASLVLAVYHPKK